MRRWIGISLSVGLWMGIEAVHAADQVYVTDAVTVGLYSSQGLEGEPVQRLLSGSRLEVLQSGDGVAQVKTQKGDVGWLRSSFLTSSLPAVVKLEKSLNEIETLRTELADAKRNVESLMEDGGGDAGSGKLKKDLDRANQQIKQLESRLTAMKAQRLNTSQGMDASQAEVERLQSENEDLRMRLAASEMIIGPKDLEPGTRVPVSWFIIGMAMAMILGAWGVYRWLDRRLLRRFGGIRFH